MNCLVCKSGTMIDSVETYFAKLNDGYVIIENVPCKKCEQCGEIVFSVSTIEKIEDLLETYKKFTAKFLLLIIDRRRNKKRR